MIDPIDPPVEADEKKLGDKARKRSATIKPSAKYPKGRFPIPDKPHAAKALQLLPRAKGLSSDQKKAIRARANKVLGKPGGKKR